MNATRDKLAALRLASQKVIDRMPLLHRAVASVMLGLFVSIIEDLLNEVEQRGQGPAR
jgi:hypothetical protein